MNNTSNTCKKPFPVLRQNIVVITITTLKVQAPDEEIEPFEPLIKTFGVLNHLPTENKTHKIK